MPCDNAPAPNQATEPSGADVSSIEPAPAPSMWHPTEAPQGLGYGDATGKAGSYAHASHVTGQKRTPPGGSMTLGYVNASKTPQGVTKPSAVEPTPDNKVLADHMGGQILDSPANPHVPAVGYTPVSNAPPPRQILSRAVQPHPRDTLHNDIAALARSVDADAVKGSPAPMPTSISKLPTPGPAPGPTLISKGPTPGPLPSPTLISKVPTPGPTPSPIVLTTAQTGGPAPGLSLISNAPTGPVPHKGARERRKTPNPPGDDWGVAV
jgi:hypothetical protein